MKKLSFFLVAVAVAAIFLNGCKKEDTITPNEILPEKFSVDIPSSISNSSNAKSVAGDTISGNETYEHLRLFIAVGEGAAEITEGIIKAIREYGLDKPMSFSYTSDEDNRVKNVEIVENAVFESKTWEYQMNIVDAESVTNADGGYAMQVFWNNSPVNGISILKPYNINRNDNELSQAMFRVEYNATGDGGYEQAMTVSISDLPLANAIIDQYSMNAMKLFVGKNGDVVEVRGNSNHPNAYLWAGEGTTGFNWAFVAAADVEQNISVAEVGLPASSLDSESRTVILVENSINNVFTNEINAWFLQEYGVTPDQNVLADYLRNTQAPGFFNNAGFVSAGTAPSENYTPLVNAVNALTPYNQITVSNLKLEFLNENQAK